MKPIDFPNANHKYAEDQPEYVTLPCHHNNDEQGTVTICWKLTWKERFTLIFKGVLWHHVLTFNNPLQPIILTTKEPTFYDAD